VPALLAFLHARLALALVLFALLLGLWGSYQFLRHRALSGGFRSAYLLMVGLTAVQGLIGLGAWSSGGRPRELLHVVYGIFAVVFLPGLYFYAGRGRRDREAAFLAAACWIVLVALLRGIATGR
jgi:CDP-diglyceride synthetase